MACARAGLTHRLDAGLCGDEWSISFLPPGDFPGPLNNQHLDTMTKTTTYLRSATTETAPRRGRPTQSEIMQRIRESGRAAQFLTREGQRVIVTRDNGDEFETTIKDTPWELGHGGWVVGVVGISGGCCTTRVRPASGKGAAL